MIQVFTRDSALIDTLRQAADRYPIRFANKWRSFVREVRSLRAPIVILDAELARDLEESIAELRQASSDAILIVAAPRKAAEQLVELTAFGRGVHRLLIKPAPLALARISIESAARLRPQEDPESEVLTARPFTRDGPDGGRGRRQARSSSNRLVSTAVVVLAVGVVGVAAVALFRDESAALLQDFVAMPDPSREASVGEGGPAASDVGAAPEARAPRERVPLAERERAAASRTPRADSGSEARPAPEADGAAAPAAQPDPARRPADAPADEPAGELGGLIELAEQSIAASRLLEPSGNNARYFLERAERHSPNDLAVFELRELLGEAMVSEARRLMERGELVEAQRLVDEAFVLGADLRALKILDADLEARTQGE